MIKQGRGNQGIGNTAASSTGGVSSPDQMLASLEDTYGYTCTPPASGVLGSFTPASGVVGSQIVISGSNFWGISSVKLGSKSMSFVRNSVSQITATVPQDAVSGKVSVAMYQNTVESEDDFVVLGGITYSVTYDGNSNTAGTPPVDTNTYNAGEAVTVLGPEDLTRTGYTFGGWKLTEGD